MSHFSVMIVGPDPEKQLAPYQENNMNDCPKEYLEFNDVEEEYREEFKTGTAKEFYCSSSSSWGQEISQKNYDVIKSLKIGEIAKLNIEDKPGLNYFKLNRKYKCYPKREIHEYPEGLHIWIEVTNIVNTNHPNKDVCFIGDIVVKAIKEPKEISLKEQYTEEFFKQNPHKKTVNPELLDKNITVYQAKKKIDEEIFEYFIKEWAGYKKDPETGKYGYWENPNRKWDWYQLGGRWRGYFKLKTAISLIGDIPNDLGFSGHEINEFFKHYKFNEEKYKKIISKFDSTTVKKLNDLMLELEKTVIKKGKLGKPGAFDNKPLYESDQAQKKDIDFEYMRNEAGNRAKDDYEMIERLFGGIPKLEFVWKDLIDNKEERFKEMDINTKRKFYHGQLAIVRKDELRKNMDNMDLTEEEKNAIIWLELDDYQCTKEEYIERAKNNAISSFALVKDGKWYEKGEMGWWACVSDEKSNWNEEFAKLLDSVPDDTLLSVYDCHI